MRTSFRIETLALLTLPVLASCSTGGMKGQDQICNEIASFAAATEPGQHRSVVLRGGWGGDTPDVLMTHDCQHAGYGPGKALCAYLLPNTSWEFGNYNAKRVARCLDSTERKAFMLRADSYEWPAEITSSLRLLADKSIQVTARLETSPPGAGKVSQLSVLTLSVARNRD